jgi:hypothetical protein
MSAPERLDDAEVEALADWLGAQIESHNVTDPSDEQTTWIEIEVEDLGRRLLASDWLAQHVARAVAEARAEGAFHAGGREVTRADYLALTGALEYGDDGFQSPAAHPRDLIDPLTEAMSAAREHDVACPEWCDECDQWERPRSCEPCHGSGCGPGTASGAYEECEHCAGDGRDHRLYTPTGTWQHRADREGQS